MTIGEKLTELRQKKKMTQKELGERLDVTDKVISRWETGKSLPDVEMMKKISETLEVTIAELYDCVGEETINIKKERGNYNRIWSYIRNSVISYIMLVLSPVLSYWAFRVKLSRLMFAVTLKAGWDEVDVMLIIAYVLPFVALCVQGLSFLHLYTYSKTRQYQLEYKKILSRYGGTFLLFLLLVVVCDIFIYYNVY